MRLRPHVSTTSTDTGMVLLDLNSGKFWELNAAGAAVLRVLRAGGSPHHATELLTAGTEVSFNRAAADVTAFVSLLLTHQLVEHT